MKQLFINPTNFGNERIGRDGINLDERRRSAKVSTELVWKSFVFLKNIKLTLKVSEYRRLGRLFDKESTTGEPVARVILLVVSELAGE